MNEMQLEQIALRAWPAPHIRPIGGWIAQFAYGHTRRANSVTALEWHTGDDLEQRIAEVERFYSEHGLPAVFRLTHGSQPAQLDAILAQRGYERRAGALVLQRSMTAGEPDLSQAAEPHDLPLATWISTFSRLHQSDPAEQIAHQQILAAIAMPRLNAAIMADDAPDQVAACAIAVLDGIHVGVFDVVTESTLRARGYGRRLMHGIMAWAARRGASHTYLQVVETNLPARRLYASLGFSEAYPYWYRVRI